jgi:hypothetical protein
VDEKLMHLLEKCYIGELKVKKISEQSSKLNEVYPPKTTLTLTGSLSKWNIGHKLGHIQIHSNLHSKDDKVSLVKKVENSEKRKREQVLQQSSKKQKLSVESQQNAKKKESGEHEEIPKKKASKVGIRGESKNQPKRSTKSNVEFEKKSK